MIIFEKPYVSDYLLQTAEKYDFPVLSNSYSQKIALKSKTNLVSDVEAINYYNDNPNARIYTNSENAISWINDHLKGTELSKVVNAFKDKAAFRDITKDMFPELFYLSLNCEDLDAVEVENLPKPFVIKPAVGFFSLAVYPVYKNEDWLPIKEKLRTEIEQASRLFPAEVLSSEALIIEGYIQGVEYAFDAYFDEEGAPTILNILKHEFASSDDVSDRVYVTSKEIMEDYLHPFTEFLINLGQLIELRNFPLHVEVRVDEFGKLRPIEVNPLRFGGFCTTADLTPYAWGFNPYAAFFNNEKPNWDEILKDKAGKIYALIVLDNSTGLKANEIREFDYDKLLTKFENPLELRRIDYHEYPLFGFVFTETRNENFKELEQILQSDLNEFIIR